MPAPNRNMLWARTVIEECTRSGVRALCLAPGSRSGPLAIAAADQPGLMVHVHLDERSAGFFALGMARVLEAPVAVLTTSGTAAANLLPAVVEAHHASVPLVVITADRPAELRGCGARQTIDQVKLFGSFTRTFSELPLPEPTPALLRAARSSVCRLVARACASPAGPVHLNVPLREPLDPTTIAGDVPADLEQADAVAARGRGVQPFTRVVRAVPIEAQGEAAKHLAAQVSESPRGIIVAGPDSPRHLEATAQLARATGYPVLADPGSPLRAGAPDGLTVLSGYDAFLRSQRLVPALQPDLVIRIGAPPVSKALGRFLETHAGATQVLIDPHGLPTDPWHLGGEVLAADPAALAQALEAALPSGPVADTRFVETLREADHLARHALSRAADERWFEGAVVSALDRTLPADTLLFAGNSMPIRELDAFLPTRSRRLRVISNHGANGIDGVVSSALGAVAASACHGHPPRAGVLLVGDLTLLHDAGGLLAAKRDSIPLTIVVINNDGGGIFGYLPVHETSDKFEKLFATPHGLDLSRLAALYDIPHHLVGPDDIDTTLTSALTSLGASLIETRISREQSLAIHRDAWQRVCDAVETCI